MFVVLPFSGKMVAPLIGFLGLAEVEKRLHLAHVGAVYKSGVVEVSLTLGALLCQNVAVVSVFSFDLSCAGERETLLRRAVGLYLWHFV